MSMLPRVGILSLILALALVPPTASAEGCLDVDYSYFGEGLRIIANSGRQLAFGIVSGDPGQGVGIIVIITPSLCGPLGIGVGTNGADPLATLGEAQRTLDTAMTHLPLP